MRDVLGYLKNRYDEEQIRFAYLEEKCTKLITLLSVLIAALGSIATIKSALVIPPNSVLNWSILAVFSLATLSLVCSWGHALQALKIDDCPVMPKSRETAVYLRDSSSEDSEQHQFNCYVDTLEILDATLDRKVKNVELAYSDLATSAWLLGTWVVLLTIREFVS